MANSVLVIDGFGIGAMPDAHEVRESDSASDTLGSLQEWSRSHRHKELDIPFLMALGLQNLRPDVSGGPDRFSLDMFRDLNRGFDAQARELSLGYPGADTFAGHQTLMGADMSHAVLCPLSHKLDVVRSALEAKGYSTEVMGHDKPIIIVDGCVLVHDNLEADPGLNWNVSGRLDEVSWDRLKDISQVVRKVAPVARVICVGGYSEKPLVNYTRPGAFGTFGMDTPATGFYVNGGLQVEHMGVDIDHSRQLPDLAASHGKRVSLIGKAADILATSYDVDRRPNVDTAKNLANVVDTQDSYDVVVANIQETDLAGHQQDPGAYCELLERVDRTIPEVMARLKDDESFVIVADHGNDPLIGHSFHTREFVPCLWIRPQRESQDVRVERKPAWDSLADVGATLAQYVGCGHVAHGSEHSL